MGTAQIANAAITDAKIASLDAGKINAGTLDAGRIAANSINASKLTIGNFTNLVDDPKFSTPFGDVWAHASGSGGTFASTSQGMSLRLAGAGKSRVNCRSQVTANPGEKFNIGGLVQNNTDNAVYIRIYWRTTAGAHISVSTLEIPASVSGWNQYDQIITAPSNVDLGWGLFTFMTHQDATSGNAWLTNPEFSQAITPELLVDGAVISRTIATGAVTANEIAANAVTTAKIATNAVTANEIAALTITANNIAANAITAAKIAALSIESGKIASNAITADKIDAGAITAVKIAANAIDATRLSATAITSKHTITGATLQTTATANRGVKIDSSGLSAYSSSGAQTVSIDSATGGVTMAGTFRNRPSGPRVEINSSDTRGRIWFYSGTSGATPASITSDPSGEGMLLWSGKASGDSGEPATLQLYERGNGDILWLGRTDTAGVHFREDGYWRVGHGGVGNFQLRASPSSNEVLLRKDPGHYVWLRNDGYTQFNGVGLSVNGSLSVSGSKNFAMEHPTKPGKQLTHASTESPHNGVEYWSDGFVEIPDEGVTTITLPAYFEALTADDHRAITVTAGSPDAGLWVEPITNGMFAVHGAPGALFTWLVKARRVQVVDGVDALAFAVESTIRVREPEPTLA
ncbi:MULTISPECIES: hypothetical protein [unclassified Microbacterium]|uniref:hypothetical protein n=1 Tax=unclassified Microbacterium TaxID=2609290 RepID=UPI00301AE065